MRKYIGKLSEIGGLFTGFEEASHVPGSLIGVKDSDFVGRPEAETP